MIIWSPFFMKPAFSRLFELFHAGGYAPLSLLLTWKILLPHSPPVIVLSEPPPHWVLLPRRMVRLPHFS